MKRRFVLLALPAMALLTAAAPPKGKLPPRPTPKPAAVTPLGDVVRVAMVTTMGTIEVELDHKHAPITVENFIRYVDTRRFDGMTFYRVMRLPWGTPPNGIIQAGLQGDPRKVLKPIAHEPTDLTGIRHKAGTLSMARNAPGTATADFSILLSDLEGFDADPASTNPELQAGYAAFGQVVSGMNVVRKIYEAPLSPTKGVGLLKGQMLDPPVRVLTVRRVASPPPAPVPSP